MVSLLLVPALFCGSHAATRPLFGIHAVELTRLSGGGEVYIEANGVSTSPGDRILLLSAAGPLGWAEYVGTAGGEHMFRTTEVGLETEAGSVAAWLIPADIAARTQPVWPQGAVLHATIETLGPGRRNAWLRLPHHVRIQAGDAWWRRIAGQPAARLDVRFVAGTRVYCAVVPLASGAALRDGDRVAMWRAGRDEGARSAVCLVETTFGETVIWIAAPRNVDVPVNPHVDIFRSRAFVADGLVQRRDDRFWYARINLRGGGEEIRVGDDVVIRTRREIERRRFVARVFESHPHGFLINAGRNDGLRTGEKATVYRGGAAHATIAIGRVQPGYSLLRQVDGSAPADLRAGDTLRFVPPSPSPCTVGTVTAVVDETLLTIAVNEDSNPPLFKPLAVSDAARIVAAAVLVERRGAIAVGFVIDATIAAPITTGLKIMSRAERAEP